MYIKSTTPLKVRTKTVINMVLHLIVLSILDVDWPQLETISLYQLSWFEINIFMCNKDFNMESLYWSRDTSISLMPGHFNTTIKLSNLKKKINSTSPKNVLHPNIIDYIFDLSQALHLHQNKCR